MSSELERSLAGKVGTGQNFRKQRLRISGTQRCEIRPQLAVESDDMTLFRSQYGEALSRDHLSGMVHDYLLAANLGKAEAHTCSVTPWPR